MQAIVVAPRCRCDWEKAANHVYRMSAEQNSKPPRVLLIEEGREMWSCLETLAKDRQLQLGRAESGFDGIEMARDQAWDLVLLNLKLRDLAGLEVLKRMRRSRRLREIPVVAVGSSEDDPEREQEKEAIGFGAVAYMRLPLDADDLRARILGLARKRSATDRLAPPDTEHRLRVRDDLLSLTRVMENVSDAVWVMEPAGRVSAVNPPFERLFGLGLVNCQEPGRIQQLFANEKQWDEILASAHVAGHWSGEVGMQGINGLPLTTHLRVIVVRDEVAGVLAVVALATNVTQRKQMEQDLMFLTDRDGLTGLWNRKAFGAILHQAIADARAGAPNFLLFLDLDNFRVVNSTLGSPSGDRLLKDVSRVLRESLRRGDEVGRYGSDEFVILLRKVEEFQAVEVSRRLLRKLDALRFSEDGRTFSANVSIGLAAIDGTTAGEEMFARAHSACHEVKNRGRNEMQVWSVDSREMHRLAADASWSIRIREALRSNRMEVWLQPVLPLTPMRPKVYFEVLLRMIGPEGNLILPGEFLPAAERFGNMLQIDEFALGEAIALMAEHSQFNLAVNLSARSLKEESLPEQVAKLLENGKVDPDRLAFEVTETSLIQDILRARKILLGLRELGCGVFLDDFGSGASSMAYLRDLPVDILKIDGSFFHTIDADQTSRTLVHTMNQMAHALGKLTVAEHVMSASVLRVTRELEIDYAQGWFVCEPCRPGGFLEKGISKLTLFTP